MDKDSCRYCSFRFSVAAGAYTGTATLTAVAVSAVTVTAIGVGATITKNVFLNERNLDGTALITVCIGVINVSYTNKKKSYLLIILFILYIIANFLFDYLFRPSNINLIRNISVALGVSIGITFGDKIFLYLIGYKKRK